MKYLSLIIISTFLFSCSKEYSFQEEVPKKEHEQSASITKMSVYDEHLRGTTFHVQISGPKYGVVWRFTVTNKNGQQLTYMVRGNKASFTVDLSLRKLDIEVCYPDGQGKQICKPV